MYIFPIHFFTLAYSNEACLSNKYNVICLSMHACNSVVTVKTEPKIWLLELQLYRQWTYCH